MLAPVFAFARTIQGAAILALSAALVALSLYVWGLHIGPIGFDGLTEKLADCREGRATDRSKYEQAQRDAQAKNRADVERIKTEQEAINAEQKSKYERDLARLRAGGLRPEYTAPPGSPGKPGAGPDANASCRADEQNVCVPRSVLVRAGEIELSRNALIDWLNAQLKVQRH